MRCPVMRTWLLCPQLVIMGSEKPFTVHYSRLAAGYVSTNGQQRAPEVTQQRTQPATVIVNAEAGEEFVWTETPDGDFENAVTDIKIVGVCWVARLTCILMKLHWQAAC
jgi:hypothetical protein